MTTLSTQTFSDRDALERWLVRHHATETELWVRVYKKGSGVASVTWEDIVIACLTWGWIDGQKKSLDATSFLQRITPRRARSGWSKKNCDHAERLISEGRMRASGLAQVEAAKKDGRWDAAYAGSSEMVIPEDFLSALAEVPKARAFYATLDRTNLFSIYHRLHTAKKPQTRAARIERILAQLARGERFH